MIKLSFEKIKYGIYPQNADFDDLPIEYEQRLFTKRPMDSLTNNIVEMLNFSLTKKLFDNWMYEGNSQNANFYYLPIYGDERLIIRQKLYRINYNIVFRLNNG